MHKYISRDLVIGIGIGFILASFLVFLLEGKQSFIHNSNTQIAVQNNDNAGKQGNDDKNIKETDDQKNNKWEQNNKVEDNGQKEAQDNKKTDEQDRIDVIIPGTIYDSEDVINILADEGIISSKNKFRERLEERGADSLLQSGVYKMPAHASDNDEIIDILIAGPYRPN